MILDGWLMPDNCTSLIISDNLDIIHFLSFVMNYIKHAIGVSGPCPNNPFLLVVEGRGLAV